jgi:ATP-dependent RNA helicase DHX8/PRP22
VIITSATLDGEKFSAYFGDCPVLSVPGRVYDVQEVYSLDDHESDILGAAVATCMQIHLHEPPGDILAFLTGQAEIDKVKSSLPYPVC